MAKKKSEGDQAPASPLNQRAWELIRSTVQNYLDNPAIDGQAELQALEASVPRDIRKCVDAVLDSYQGAKKSYRIALIGQLAYGIESDTHLDLTQRQSGARGATGVGGRVGSFLADRHIVSVDDAYQNIAKNNTDMVRGNFPEFDAFLNWAADARRTKEEYRAVFRYCCWHVARTSRPVLPLPDIDPGKMKFAAVMTLFDAMLSVPSGGAHQQFITAALLEAREEQADTGRYVETKNISASDQSAKTAADVQMKTGTKVEEAFEVTANQWTEKLAAAAQKIRAYDLSRLHIIAGISDYAAMLSELAARPEDISVLELRGFIAALVAELRRAGRAAALKRLYELLDRHQPEVELVNAYVRLLRAQGLVLTAAQD